MYAYYLQFTQINNLYIEHMWKNDLTHSRSKSKKCNYAIWKVFSKYMCDIHLQWREIPNDNVYCTS